MFSFSAGKDKPNTQSPTPTGRRGFLRNMGLGAASAMAFGGAALSTRSAKADATLDLEILNFALNLEYLEASFYNLAATGVGLAPVDLGPNPGVITGGKKVTFDDPIVKAYAIEIAMEEKKHVQFLRAAITALGGTPVSCPALDLDTSFKTLASAAGLNPEFHTYANSNHFLLASYVFEDVGVTAYHGAAPLISNSTVLDKAAGILAVEAYHAGLIRTVLFAGGFSDQTAKISALRATLDGTIGTTNVDDEGVGTLSMPSIVNCSNALNAGTTGVLGGLTVPPPGNNAIAFDRTTTQVLAIVYGAKSVHKGLFFPNGLNGSIT